VTPAIRSIPLGMLERAILERYNLKDRIPMARAKIGIRYCGGCNPRYERVEMIQWVQSRVGDRFLFVRHDQQDLDGLIAVNGCPRACSARHLNQLNQREVPCHSVAEKSDLSGLMEWLSTFKPGEIKE